MDVRCALIESTINSSGCPGALLGTALHGGASHQHPRLFFFLRSPSTFSAFRAYAKRRELSKIVPQPCYRDRGNVGGGCPLPYQTLLCSLRWPSALVSGLSGFFRRRYCISHRFLLTSPRRPRLMALHPNGAIGDSPHPSEMSPCPLIPELLASSLPQPV